MIRRRSTLLAVLACGLIFTATTATGAEPAATPVILEPGTFTDDDGSIHAVNIEAIAAAGITTGCNPPDNDEFCPELPTTRAEMATFLVRALDLPSSATDYFSDDDGSVHEANINALAEAGITRGCNPPTNDLFCPAASTSREQMATFLMRALDLPATTTDYFGDDSGSVHEANINALASAGITSGCNPPTNTNFCPTQITTREQMASFITRALKLQAPRVWPMLHDASSDPIPGSSYAWHLAHGELGYLAAGLTLSLERDAGVWTSADGLTWDLIPNPESVFGGPSNVISVNDVAVGTSGMVAVGSSHTSGSGSDAAVWLSTDRLTWSRVPHNEAIFGDDGSDSQSMNAALHHPTTGFIAVGTEQFVTGTDDLETPDDTIGVVWTSPNGSDWVRNADGSGDLAGDRTVSMRLVAQDHDVVVAMGTAQHGDMPAFWWSPDGTEWNRAPDPTGLSNPDWFAVTAITSSSQGFLAVGMEAFGEERTSVTYFSPNGLDWTRRVPKVDGQLSGVTFHDGTYFAVGRSLGDDGGSELWQSSDGTTWVRLGEPSDGAVPRWTRTALSTPIGLLIGGTWHEDHTLHAAIWLGP